ncbi:MAG TPA: PKD domain-containing protein, partial [Longimicrobiaceae bacterium]
AGRINVYRAITGKDPNAPPVAVVDGPYTAVEGQAVAFSSAGSIDPNGKPVTFAWNFGDGSSSTEANPSHTYADNGAFAVTLTVTDQSGLARTTASTSTIANAAPAVSSALSAGSIVSGGSVSLTGSFSDAGTIDAPWTYAINWGNGTTGGTLSAPAQITGTRQFCAAGDYAVRLSVTDKDGGTGSDVSTLTVTRGAMPVGVQGPFNLKSNGTYPVTIFSRPGFDPASIDPATVSIITNGAVSVNHRNNGTVHAGYSDENGDGVADLVVHFDRQVLVATYSVTASTTQLVLHADLKNGCGQVRGVAPISVN